MIIVLPQNLLWVAGPNEKNLIGMMLDRETKREKSLDQIKKQGGVAKKETRTELPNPRALSFRALGLQSLSSLLYPSSQTHSRTNA